MLGALLFFALLSLFSSLVLMQVTSEGVAKRALQRSVASLTEIDVLIDRDYDDLRQRAAVAAPGDKMTLRAFPIDVPMTPAQASSISKADLRSTLLERSADVMYSSGTAPLRDPASKAGNVGVFSIAGVTDHALDFLRSRNHDILRVLTLVLAVVSIVCAVAFALACRGPGRITAVGAVILAAALPVLVAGLATWAYMSAHDGGGEYTQRQFAAIGRDLAWVAVRDGAALAGLGAAMVALGVLLSMWSSRGALPARVAGRAG